LEIGIASERYEDCWRHTQLRETKLQAQYIAVNNCGSHFLICGSPSWKAGPIEGAMSLRLSPAARPQRPLGGLHRTQSAKTKRKNPPQLAADVSVWFISLSCALFTNSKFRMNFLALIRVMHYYAESTFKRG
jgi:hypothetical protein